MAPGTMPYYCKPLTQSPGGPEPTPQVLKAEGFLQLAEATKDSKPSCLKTEGPGTKDTGGLKELREAPAG